MWGDVKLSVVIPVYNESLVIPELCKKLREVLSGHTETREYEVILVNDGSRDDSLEKMRVEREKNDRIKILNLSRNFGHQTAITAGMDHASGDAVAVMDADLQDPPEVLAKMMEKIVEGYDVVYGKRSNREGESPFKKMTAAIFYRLLKKMTNIDIPLDTGDFRIVSRRVANDFKNIREKNRFVRGIISWVGYRQIAVEYDRHERYAGVTKYPLKAMLKFAWDGVTSFSITPLRMATMLGFCSIILGLLYAMWVLYVWIVGDIVHGWSSLMIIILFFSGVQLMILGIIGEYIGRISEEVKRRPLYLVDTFD